VNRILRFCLISAVLGLLAPAAGSAYSWPLRPFYKEHAIRGYFSDPRLSETERSFHFGVDIVADDLQPVYAIEGGRAYVRGTRVAIYPKRGGHRLSYWHVMPAVRSTQLVRQRQLIGHVVPGMGHVHLAEYRDGRYINPLRLGGLAPYIDDTVPQIPKLTFYSFGNPVAPENLTGFVEVTIDAFDPPPLPALPDGWTQAKLAPALIRWRIVQGQNTVKPWETAVDFRTFLLPKSLFDFVYAPGTYQNKINRPGRYEFYLAHELETGLLPNGSYVLQVDVLDDQENLGQASFAFTIRN
jgi:murein DD-endopeptidase MepM/ murein hydrolase activator NlpD